MLFLVLLKLISLNLSLFADDVIVITADRIKTKTDKSTSDVKIIEAEEIKNNSSKSLPELLSKESDLSVVTSGPNGSSASLFLRGNDSSHTLFVIDGIVMNDPSNPNRQFDIGRLSLNNIERIEILKGSQSLAYGSNAIGGVVVITTKKATLEKITGDSYFDYGTFNTLNTGANFQKKYDLVNLSVGADYMSTDGFSAANQNVNPNAEKDGSHRATFSLGASKALSENYDLDLNLHYSDSVTDVDKGGGAGNDDPNDRQKEEEFYSKLQLTKNWEAGNAQTKFGYNYSKHFRLTDIIFDPKHTESSREVSTGEINSFNINHTYYINEALTQNFNLELSREQDQAKNVAQNLSAFLYHQYELPSSIFNFGARIDHNNFNANHFSYKLAIGKKFTSSLLKLSYATGFRSPSLNQLFDPTYGNKNLIPETSQSWDLSLEKNRFNGLKMTTTTFYTLIDHRFGYNPITFINRNMNKSEIIGLEENANMDWTNIFNQSLSATLLKTRDLKLGSRLARRPDFNIKNTFSVTPIARHQVDYELFYTGHRSDVDNNGNTVTMSPYMLSNLNYRYKINEQKAVYFKVKNIFNTDYEEIYGYGAGGRMISAGAQYFF